MRVFPHRGKTSHAFMKISSRKRQTDGINCPGGGSANDRKGIRRLIRQHFRDGAYYPYLIRRTRATAG